MIIFTFSYGVPILWVSQILSKIRYFADLRITLPTVYQHFRLANTFSFAEVIVLGVRNWGGCFIKNCDYAVKIFNSPPLCAHFRCANLCVWRVHEKTGRGPTEVL